LEVTQINKPTRRQQSENRTGKAAENIMGWGVIDSGEFHRKLEVLTPIT